MKDVLFSPVSIRIPSTFFGYGVLNFAWNASIGGRVWCRPWYKAVLERFLSKLTAWDSTTPANSYSSVEYSSSALWQSSLFSQSVSWSVGSAHIVCMESKFWIVIMDWGCLSFNHFMIAVTSSRGWVSLALSLRPHTKQPPFAPQIQFLLILRGSMYFRLRWIVWDRRVSRYVRLVLHIVVHLIVCFHGLVG